jgi:hypothetical protein
MARQLRSRARREQLRLYTSAMKVAILRWLRATPRLMSAYLVLLNRGWRGACGGLLAALGLIVVCTVIVAFSSVAGSMYRHRLFLAGLAAFAAGVVVARRRALKRAEAVRSWLAALPARPATARWEALAIETAPAVGAICVWTTALGIVAMIAALAADDSAIGLMSTWGTVSAGIVMGSFLSYLAPAPKPIDLPPGSRYVPHRHVTGTATLEPSLSALGRWPVRRMFASARPKAVARAVMPILLLMPLGSSADTAMLIIAMFAVLGAMLLLVAATISVSKASCRWLQPLPIKVAVLARSLLIQPLAVIVGGTSVGAWLFWVMGVGVGQSAIRGALLMLLSSCFAVGGSLGAIYRTSKGRR